MAEFDIVTRATELQALAKDLIKQDVVAVDTEADSFYHYFDKTCLVQIATHKQSWLIDPLALGGPKELAPLGPVMASTKVRKIFHAAEYDLFVLKRDCGFEFANLFDTMISAQLLGYKGVGLAALIEHHFDVSLPKDEQRSDWSRRPLTDKQLTYAASDVVYLIRLADTLERELKKAGRLEWAEDEFKALRQRKWADREFDKLGYLRIKGARGLDPVSLGVLRELYLMRDERAREVDRPPFKILGNRTLLQIAEKQALDLDELAEIKGITELILKRMGPDLVAAVKKGVKKPHGPIPKLDSTVRKRMDRRTEKRLAALKTWRGPRAAELELDPGVLCPNAALEAIAWADPKSKKDLEPLPELKAWFIREFGDEIVEVVDAERQRADDDPKPEPRSRRGRSRGGRGSGQRGGRSEKGASKASAGDS